MSDALMWETIELLQAMIRNRCVNDGRVDPAKRCAQRMSSLTTLRVRALRFNATKLRLAAYLSLLVWTAQSHRPRVCV